MTRCAECGMTEETAKLNVSTHCAPPFHRQQHDFSGAHPADMLEGDQASLLRVGQRLFKQREPLDTSQLGRIAVDPGSDKIKAGMVREALDRAARTLWDQSNGMRDDFAVKALRDVTHYASDETLLSIYRMLRS